MKKLAAAVAVVFLALLWVPPALAREPQCPELSLEQAVARALRYSKTLERSVLDVTYADEARDDASLALVGGFGADWATNYEPGVEGPYAGYLAADYGYEKAQKMKELQEDIVVADVHAKYYGILKAKEKLAAAEAALAAEEKKYAAAEARFQVGMLSRTALNQAAMQLAQRRAELASAQSSLDNAYVAFNQLIGLYPEDRPVLTDTVTFAALEVSNLSSVVAGVVGDNPLQWIADEGAELQERLIGLTGSGDQAEILADQAELDAAIMEEDTRTTAYSLYYTVKQLEEAYNAALEGVRVAEEGLRVARVMYEVGLVAATDVVSAEAALAQANQALFDLACQHELMKMAFYKPWTAGVLMGGTGSGSSASGGSQASSGHPSGQ